MMSDDLEWTQAFGDALAYQQKDVLIAIQQLREEAVAKNIIKSDDKMKVETSGDNIVIQSASTEQVYVPRYEPAMLYEPSYPAAPISYYPEPYPSYWYPTATFFAAAATGAIWAAAVDWDDWGIWGGDWDGGDIDFDCNNCLNNIDFNGKLNLKDVDWKNVDRSKLNLDRSQLAKLDRTNIKNIVRPIGRILLATGRPISRGIEPQTSPTGRRKSRIFARALWRACKAGLAATWREPALTCKGRPRGRPQVGATSAGRTSGQAMSTALPASRR